MEEDVKITIIDRQGKSHEVQAPTDMNMNLMEVCRAFDLPVLGTCGGMAMCASCQVYIESPHSLPKKEMEEEAMLSEAFYVEENSRLGCQIPITKELEGLVIKLAPED